jgi:hypothetical protein
MTQYMISVIHGEDDAIPPGVDFSDVVAAVDKFNAKMEEAGRVVFAGGLQPISASTVVDGTADEPLVTDGPYLESREYLGGFWVLEAADLDEAIALAKEASTACYHSVEVRPFQEG